MSAKRPEVQVSTALAEVKRSPPFPVLTGITGRQEAFALAFCRLANASAAYREVYQPSTAAAKTVNEAASRLLKNSKVAARVAELRAAAEGATMLTIKRFRTELARVCFSNICNAFDQDGNPRQIHEMDIDTAAAIERYEIKERVVDGAVVSRKIRVKFWNKNAALDMAARHLGLYQRDNARSGENVRLVVVFVG